MTEPAIDTLIERARYTGPTVEASELDPTHILLTHGHADHYGDIQEIAKRTSAQVVAAYTVYA